MTIPDPIIADENASAARESRSPARMRQVIGSTIGIGLLAAAIIMVWRQHGALRAAVSAVGSHPPGALAGLAGLLIITVLANIVLSGAMFSLLMSRSALTPAAAGDPRRGSVSGGSVGVLEMQCLIASATLMNYLPLRPGLLGRIAWHKTMNSIAVRDSVKAVAQAIALSATASAYLTTIALFCQERFLSPWLFALSPFPILLLASALTRGTMRRFLLAGAVRLADVLMTAVRYHAAFSLLGSPIEWTGAMAFACISVIATLVPLIGNGLGLREWAIGLLAPAIASYSVEQGVTADLLNRAAELVVVTCAGVPAMLWLVRRAPRHTRGDIPSTGHSRT